MFAGKSQQVGFRDEALRAGSLKTHPLVQQDLMFSSE